MILGIDPGITFCGVCVGEYTDTGVFKIHHAELINNNLKFEKTDKDLINLHGKKVAKLLRIANVCLTLIENFPIECIVMEKSFFNPGRPNAFGSLLEVISVLRFMVAVPCGKPLFLYPPKSVKNVFSGDGSSLKTGMLDALTEKTKANVISLPREIELLSEHEIDAVAIAYTHHVSPLSAR